MQVKLLGKVVALQVIKTVDGQDEVMQEDIVDGGIHEVDMVLRIVAEKQLLKFEYGHDERNMNLFMDKVDSTFLSPDKCNGCSGIMVGMFAVAGGDFSQKQFHADFDWFKYENITREFIS
jgi:alpha-N-arabinofuranosidase